MNRVRIAERIASAVEFDPNGGCWLWTRRAVQGGYGAFRINGKHWLVHRASWAATNGPIPDGMIIRHKCDVPQCVNPGHLLLGTPLDNRKDCVSRGRASGAKVGRRNLTVADVDFIRDRLAAGWKDERIAKALGVARQSVGRRRRRAASTTQIKDTTHDR